MSFFKSTLNKILKKGGNDEKFDHRFILQDMHISMNEVTVSDDTWINIDPNEPAVTTKITDLHMDCLERIFEYLKLDDLLNVTDASKEFEFTAQLVARKHLKKNTIVKLNITQNSRDRSSIHTLNCIIVQDLRSSFQLLRSFGHLVKKLHVLYAQDVEHFEKLLRYIEDYGNHMAKKDVHISTCNSGLRQLLGHVKKY